MTKSILLFDVDGTLLMTGGAGRIAFDGAFRDLFGIENAYEGTRPDGMTDPLIIQEIAERRLGRPLSQEEFRNICDKYIFYFLGAIDSSERFRLLPGVRNLFEILSEKNELMIGVATGNFEVTAKSKLERGGLRHFFKFGGFGDNAFDRTRILEIAAERGRELFRRSSPEAKEKSRPGEAPYESCDTIPKDRIFVIGDTPLDIRAAKTLSFRTVAVATGRWTASELKAYGPDYVLEDFSDPQTFISIFRNGFEGK